MYKLKDFSTPFTLYDFFGYFLPGFFFLILFIIEYDAGDIMNFYVTNPIQPYSLQCFTEDFTKVLKFEYLNNFIQGADGSFSFLPFLVFIILLYLAGHINASVSSFLLEKLIVEKMIGYPSKILINKSQLKHSRLKRFFFGPFLQPLDIGFIEDFEKIIEKRFGKNLSISNYFWLCFTDISRYAPIGYKRVIHFLNLYGFARNVSMCFFAYIGFRIIILNWVLGSNLNSYNYLILVMYFVAGIIMFYNYLKLFGRQCKELYFHFYSIHTPNLINSENSAYSFTYGSEK